MAELRVKSTGTIKLFESDNTSSVTIASPASLGADRTITLPDADVTLVSGTMSTGFAVTDITGQTALGATPADTDEFVLSDAGVLKRVDYSYLKGGDNTPSFYAYQSTVSTAIATDTYTELPWSTTSWDTDSAFASNGFTVPTGEDGKYLINGIFCITGLDDNDRWDTHVTIDGSRNAKGNYYNAATGSNNDLYNNMSVIVTLAAGEKVTIEGFHGYGSDRNFNGTHSYFAGYKLIGI